MTQALQTPFKIAIIVRTKDRPRLLTRCLQSLADQQRLPDEIILVNDGGIDVNEVVQAFSALPIHLLQNKTSRGRAQAGNQGVQATQCDVIGFLDDDDRFLPDHMQRLEHAMVHFDAQVVYSGCRLLQRDLLGDEMVLREQAIGEFNDPFEPQRLRHENYIPMINLLINRKLWLSLGGFDESFEIFEDWEVLWRLSSLTAFYHVDRITTEYSIWGSSQITQAVDRQRWIGAYRKFLEKHLLPLSESEGLDSLAGYWFISQERRNIVRETTEDKRSLQLKLIQNQQIVEESQRHLAEYKSHYERLQRELTQSQNDWQKKYEQLQHDYTKLQENWSNKYEQSQGDWNRKCEQLQHEYGQLQSEWSHKYENLQSEWNHKCDQLQSDWSRKYEQLQSDWTKKYEKLDHDRATLHMEWSKKYEKLQEEWQDKYKQLETQSTHEHVRLQKEWTSKDEQWQVAYNQQEAHFKQQQTEMLQEIDKNVSLYHELQDACQRDQACCKTFHITLHEMHRQLALGLTQATLERVLSSHPPLYTSLVSEDVLRANYQRLVEWYKNKHQSWEHEEKRIWEHLVTEWQGQLQNLRKENQLLDNTVKKLSDKIAKCRWFPYRCYDKPLNQLNIMVEGVEGQLAYYLNLLTKKKISNLPQKTDWQQELPPPKQVSGLYPSLSTFAGTPHAYQTMESMVKQGRVSFHLGPQNSFIFTIRCTLDHFSRFDIALATYMRINDCHLRIILREVGQSSPIRVILIHAITILDNLLHPICFEPIVDSKGKTYQVEIDSPDADNHNALAIWCHAVQPPSSPPPEASVPTVLPHWLQQGFFDYSFSERFTESSPCHLFIVTGVTDLLSLQVFLRRIEKLLIQQDTSGQIIVCGEVSGDVQTYCREHRFQRLVSSDIAHILGAVLPLSHYLWFCQVQAMFQLDSLQRVSEVFEACPHAALLVPLQIRPQGTISAAYALIDSYAHLHHFPIGAPADHPHHGYRRVIEASSSHLLVLKTSCLDKIDPNALTLYQTTSYRLTDLIWQLKEQQLETIYDSTFFYYNDFPPDQAASEEDRELFLKRWQSALMSQTNLLISQHALLNPKRLPSILVIDATLPAYDEDSGSLRLLTLMKMMIHLGYHVTFFPDNLDSQFKYRHVLEALGIEVFHSPYNIAEALSYRSFDFAMVCRVEMGHRYIPFLRLVTPRTKIFYDTVDIHYIRELRQAEIENNPQLAIKAQETKRKELANCLLSDRTLTVTLQDALHLQEELPHLDFMVLPNVHVLQALSPTSFEQREGLLFIGNYNHQPNEDAVYYFIEQVLPKIHRRLPEITFSIVGSNMKEKMKNLASEQIQIVGWVDEVEPEFAKRRVFVSYLRYGAGMKGKIGQALSLGLPVVTTSIGAEGMGLTEGETALIADDPEKFAEAVCRLYTDKALWEKLASQGREYIEHQFGEEAVKQSLGELLT